RIFIIDENNNFADKMPDLNLPDHKIILSNNNAHFKYLIEEYMPDYIVLSARNGRFKEIYDYIKDETDIKLVITDNDCKNTGRAYECGFTGNIETVDDMEKVLITLENLSEEKKQDREYKYIRQEVISVYSVQGGVGKTTIAFNMAWYYGSVLKQKILLVDLNFCEGPSDLALNLNLDILKNMGRYIRGISNGNPEIRGSVNNICEYVDIMHPPLSIYQSDRLNTGMLDSLIYSARNEYQMIIADVPFRYDNISLEMLNLSTTSILILSPDIILAPRVKGMERLLPENQKKNIIFNRVNNWSTPILEEYASLINIPVLGYICNIRDGEKINLKQGRDFYNILNIQTGIAGLNDILQ
ncbi:MAG: AAA family ATPase, partial [Actinobacteria bacterium]|nr:AAA family ATPase [Actinomycetota bacterium]